jgi:hypothetical protein
MASVHRDASCRVENTISDADAEYIVNIPTAALYIPRRRDQLDFSGRKHGEERGSILGARNLFMF